MPAIEDETFCPELCSPSLTALSIDALKSPRMPQNSLLFSEGAWAVFYL
jgi:hypothetical protein